MGNKCCKNQSSTYSSANATIRSFSSYNSSILRSGGSHAITFGTSTRAGDSLTTLTMKSSNHSDVGSKDYRGGSSSTVGQEDLIPIFLRRLNDLNIRVGTRTRFLIELDDATGVQVRWYHNNVEADSERYQYIHEGGFYCLDIVPVTLFDEGLWVCTAQNYAGKSSTAAHLSLTVPKAFKKPIFVEQLKAVLTQRGIVSLECKVIGVPTPKLRWYKDDKEIKAGDIFALTANSEEDCLGIYTCEATNVMGTALSTSKIQVTHTPLDGNHDADSLIPYGPPPKFEKFLKDASGKVGSVLFLECQVEVPPWPRSIGWYNDNGIVSEGPLYHLIADGLGMYGVEIKSLRADHSTTWKCVATSSTGAKAVTSCVVSVSYPKNYRVPRFLESLRAIMTDEGLVSFECKVIGYPTPQLSWFKDGKQLQPGDVYELTGSKSLGSYCCVARNCMGETSSLAELTIEDIQNQLNESEKLQLTSNTQPPRFLLGLKSVEANINESIVFMIKVTTESTPSISWYKEDEQLTESNRYQFSTEDNGTYILNIVPLEIDDQAEWKCVAINKYGQTATSSFLKLNIPKNFKCPRFLEELRIAFSNEGSVNLECKVIGVPQPQLKWFKDGQELNPGDMHKIISGQSGTCCLGTYTCQAHNCMGTVSSSATLLTMEDKSTVKSCASEEYLSVGNPLVRNESLSTIPEERTSQMEKSYTIEEPADISFSFDGKEVTVSLYETPDLTHDEALQIIEMYADELSEHISEDNVVDLPSLRIVKESSISGPVMMEALVIDVPIDFCRQQTVSDTEFDGVSLTEDITLANNDKSDSICENSLEYFSDHLSSGNSKRELFYSASETTPKNSSKILKQKSEDDGHQSFQTPKLFMSDSDDQILTQLKLDERLLPQNSRQVARPLARSESNNTEEEVSETLAEIENEPPLSHNYCASEIVTQSDEDGLYSTVLNKIRGKELASVILSSEEDDVLKIISRPNVDEFLKYMKIILEGTMVKMNAHENFNFTCTMTELERSIQALHSLAWKFIEETERNDVTELDKNTADNVSCLMTAINASLLALEQIDDPFGVSDNVLNEIQSSVCFDLETLNNNDLSASVILDRLSDQIKNFTIVVNRQVARVTEQRIIAVLRNTIGTTLVYIKTLQQNCSKIKCVDINSLAPLFSMVQPLETILNDIAVIEEAYIDDNKPNLKLKQILIPPISSIAFALDNLNTALKNDSSAEDQDLKDIYEKINESTNQFMQLASQGMECNKIAECFISFTKPINDLCCHLRRLGRSTENIVSSDYGSDDKLLVDFETLFDELMIDIDTLINNVNFVQDSENNMNPLGSLLEPLQDMKIGLFQVNQVLLSNQTGSTMSYEVMSCFEHLSQQLVQLNNCIVNQSIVEETDKEIPFESSIKMMQNILFDDAIDDLGVNGILFGSVMKPLLQLQNLIVSKMASVESDLSFSEHTDVTGGACDTQSLSLSLSNNAQTVFDKTSNENSKQVITTSSIIDSSDKECDKKNNIHRDTSEVNKDSLLFGNHINNELVIKRGFECDIGETFKDEEPNIITSEDDRDNSGLEALFDETDLETVSDFVEDICLDSSMNSNVDSKLSELFMSQKNIDIVHGETDDIIPKHVIESLEKSNQQDLIFNSPVDLLDEIQDTLNHMSEVTRDGTTEMYDLDTSNIDSKYCINQICDKTNDLIDDTLDVDKINNSSITNSDKLTKQNIKESIEAHKEINQCNKIILKIDQNETFNDKGLTINDQDAYKEELLFEIGQDADFVENFECLDSDKSISNNTVITVNDISDSSEVKIKEIDSTKNVKTVLNLLASTTDNVSQIVEFTDTNESLIPFVDVLDKNETLLISVHNVVSKMNDKDEVIKTLSDFKNETFNSIQLNSTESVKNMKDLPSELIMVDENKFNESEEINILNNHSDIINKKETEIKEKIIISEVEVPSIIENVSPQDDGFVNEIDTIHNLETDIGVQVAQTSIGNEFNTEKDKQNSLIDKCTYASELNKGIEAFLVEEKNDIIPENKLVIEDHDSLNIEEIANKINQLNNSDSTKKSICVVEEKVTPLNELTSTMVDINLITVLENNISKGVITEEQNNGNQNLSMEKNKLNDFDTFEVNQDVDLDKKLQHELQPNINTASTTDNKQLNHNFTNFENMENPIGAELNVLQTEEYVLLQKHDNESQLINEEHLKTVQQITVLQQSNNEVKTIEELNEQCETLSDINVNNKTECIGSKIVLPIEIIYPEDLIDVKSVVEHCVLDSTNHINDISITQCNVEKCVGIMLPINEVMAQTVESNELDKQLVLIESNDDGNENKDENNEIIDNIATKSKNDEANNSVDSTLNEKEIGPDEKINIYSENKAIETLMNDEKKSINTLNKTTENLKQHPILENNDSTLLENTLINKKIITLENTLSIDPYKFDENQVEIQLKEDIDSRTEYNTILDSKGMISNLEHLETKNEILKITFNEDEDKLPSEVQNDLTQPINETANFVVDQTTALICNETISESNAQPLDTVVIDLENIKELFEKESYVPESKSIAVLEDIVNIEGTNNQQCDDIEKMPKDKLISKNGDKNNLIYSENKSDKSTTNEFIEIQTSESIDEKPNSLSSEDILKNNGDVLEKINNLSTENIKEKIMTKSQLSNESEVEVILTENNSATTCTDLETTKTNIEKGKDDFEILASEKSCLLPNNDQIIDLYDAENDLAKHKCLFLVNENTCDEGTNHPSTCIELLNENNVNQHEQLTEVQTNVTLENFDTLEIHSNQEPAKTNTISNEDNLNRNDENLEINKTDEKNSIDNDTDKKQSLTDVCKSMENQKVLVNDKNQTIYLYDIKHDNLNEKPTEDLENNQEIAESNYEKSLVSENNLRGTDNLKIREINSEEVIKEFIVSKDFELSNTKLETTIDDIPIVDSNKSTKQKEVSTFEKLSTDKLNITLEPPKSEYLFIERPNSNFSDDETSQFDAKGNIIDQHNETSKTETQNMSDVSKERVNVMTEDYPSNHSCKSNSPLIEALQNEGRSIINDNDENDKIKPDSINYHEDKFNEVKNNSQIIVVTAQENNVNILNDITFEGEISDLSAKDSFGVLSILPPCNHGVENIAANGTECVMLETTNIMKHDELNSAKNFKQHAQVEHELNIAAIGNIIIDYDTIKENSLTADEGKKCTENAIKASISDNHSFKTVSTNVDVLNDTIKDTTIKKQQLAINELCENSAITTTLLNENKTLENLEINILDDKIENTDNLVIENLETKIGSLNKSTEIFNVDTDVYKNEVLKKDQSKEVVDKKQQGLEGTNQIIESLVLSAYEDDTTDGVRSDILITNIETTKDEKTSDTKDKVDTKRKLSPRSKKSSSPSTSTNNIAVRENEIETNASTHKTIDQTNSEISDEIKNVEKVEIKLDNLESAIIAPDNNTNREAIIEKFVLTDDQNIKSDKIEICSDNQTNLTGITNDRNKNQKNNGVYIDNQILTETKIEEEMNKRGSKKKKSSPRTEDKKSPSPDPTNSNISVTENKIDTAKNIDTCIEEKKKEQSDGNKNTEKNVVETDILESEEKVVIINDQNENQKNIGNDINSKNLTESKIEENMNKRGSKKKKSSPRTEDKKSPSPDPTNSNISVTENKIDTAKNIDTCIEEKKKEQSDGNKNTEKNVVETDILESEEKVVITNDQNENQKNIGNDINSKNLTESKIEENMNKRGSKKKKSSHRTEDKKSPSPDPTNSNISVTENKIDTAKNIDTCIEEKKKEQSDGNKNTEKNVVETDILESEEKVVITNDQNENQKNIGVDINSKNSTESKIEENMNKRGSKKKKSSHRTEDKKSPSPDPTNSNISVTENKIDTAKNIDTCIEEKNERSDDSKNTEKNVVETDILESEEKVVITNDQNENQKNIGVDINSKNSTESKIEENMNKRGSKKKKSSPRTEDKKSPSPDPTNSNISVTENKIDTAKNIDTCIEEKKKEQSDGNKNTEKNVVETDILESEEKVVITNDQNENQKNIGVDINSKNSTESKIEENMNKRGSKKKKSSHRREDKKSPSPDPTKSNISVTENKIDTANNIDTCIEEKKKELSDDNKNTEKNVVETVILESEEKVVITNDQNENQKNIGVDINSKNSTESKIEENMNKRGSKKKKSSHRTEDKKSPSPDPTNSNISVTENKIDTAKNIDTCIEEKNERSDDSKNTEKNVVETDILESEEKVVITNDQNENQKNIGVDINSKNSTESKIEENMNKRGSKKKKSSPRTEDKKSPSPDPTNSNISVTENKIDTAKNIDTCIEEKKKEQSDGNKNTEKNVVETDILESEEKVVITNDQNENQKNIGVDINSKNSTESKIEENMNKRGSKKKKSSHRREDKKSPSPDPTKSNISVTENKIDTANNIDTCIEEKKKELSDDNKNTEKNVVETVILESEEKVVITNDQNENQKNIGVDINSKNLTESKIEENMNKRGSKKKKSSTPSEDKKSPSPDSIKSNISVTENKIDTAKNIDTCIDEKNIKQLDANKITENVVDKLHNIELEIAPDNNENPEEVIGKNVSTSDQNKNQRNTEISTDSQITSTENYVDKDRTRRGSKKTKSKSGSEDKNVTSPNTEKSNICVIEKNDSIKIIDKSIEEDNKKLFNDYNDTEKHGSELESEFPVEGNNTNAKEFKNDNSVQDTIEKQKYDKLFFDEKESTEKNIERVNEIDSFQKNNEISDENQLSENGIDKKKRGSIKKKSSQKPEINKISSLDTTENNVSQSEKKFDSKIIDATVEDNNRKILDYNKNSEQVITKVKREITADHDTHTVEKIEKGFSNNTKIENKNNNEIDTDDKIKSTENVVEKFKTKRESKKEKSSPGKKCKKSISPDKTNKIINEKIEINDEIEKKENTISDLTDNFTNNLPNNNTVLDKMEKEHDINSLENNYIKIIGMSKKNKIDSHLLTNTDKRVGDNNKSELESVTQKTSSISPSLEKSVRMDSKVNENVTDKQKDNTTNCFTTILKEQKLTGKMEHNVLDVPDVQGFDKRPFNRYVLDVTDTHKLRPNNLTYRSLTPDPLTSYRNLTPDHLSSYRSLTPESPSYRSYLTPKSKYATPTRYAGSSDRELHGGSSSSHSSRSSSRSTSPYPPDSRISARSLCPPNVAAYRCLSETSIPLSSRYLEVETTSSWPHTSYGVTTRRRRGSDSFLHDSGVRDGGYYSSWRLSDGRSSTYGVSEDLYRTKEAFKGLYFCVRMIDQTVSSGARVKFWCSVIGHPEPRVQWYRDGQKLNSFTYNSSARYTTKYNGGLAQLIVDNAQSGDSGEYTCVASNGRDRISTTGFLTVYTSPSVFRKPLLQPSLSVDGIESGRGLYSRTSHDSRLPANAKFDFGFRKIGGDLASRRPEYPKFVSSIIADDVATYGGTIALQVRVQGSPVPNVTWMRESRPLPRLSGKYVHLDEGGLYTLLVMDSTARDGGTYVCRACNLYGVADAEKAVRVVSPQDYTDRRGVKPAIIVSRPNDRLNVAVGEDITVTLRVAGEPKPKVIWMRGSRDVTFLDRSLKETVNDYVMLSIKKAQPSDAGTYFIIAKNVYGSDRAFVTVGVRKRARSLTPPQMRNTIGRWFRPMGGGGGRGGCANNEVPGPVRSEPTVTDRTNNRISLQWDRPEKPETVLVYRVETRSANEECWRQVGMTPTNTIDVYNLKPGYRYQFRVAARNRFGWSQPVAGDGYVDVFEPKCLPEFRQPLPGQTRVLLRHSATLQCHVRGVPEPRVRWLKDGEPLLASDRHAVGRTDGGKCTLTIADAVDEDAGRYSCEAVNDQGRVCTLTVVQVIANRRIVEAERRLQGCLMKNNDFKESAPVFTKHLIDRRVEINSTVRLSCQVNGLPVPLVLWYKDGRPVDFAGETEGDRKPPVRDDSDDFYTLELTGVKYDDSGAYAAVASNAIGKASTRCVLEVFNKNRTDPAVPAFVFGLPPTSEAVDSIVLSAQIDAYRPVKVEWFRDGIQLRNGRRVDIITDHDGNLELRIACVTKRDSGTYMLRVSNDTGTVESRCDVSVVEREHSDSGMEQISLINHLYSKKPKFVVKPKFQEVEEGQEVIIDSEIVGDPLPKITWLRDGLKPEYYRDNSEFLCISNGNRYQLKIPHAKLTHTGTYTLLAANPHGQIKALISLQVYSTGHCKKKMENGTNHTTVERLPRISRGLVDIECRENDNVSFECKLNITQETDIRWQKDGKLVRLGKQIKSQLVDGDTARLDISTASPLHEGLYTCTAFNELGQDSTSARLILLSDSQETAKAPQSNGQQTMLGSPILAGETNDRSTKRLKRSSAPKFYAVLHDRIADVGETVRFLCSVSGHPPPWSSWEKDGQPIGVNSRMRIREDDDHRSLEICDVTSDDAGLYRITVENKFGKIQATARLEVLTTHNQTTNDVQITSSSNGRRQSGSAACAGENFTLSCDIRGNSMSDVTWYKDDEEVKPDDRVTSSLDDLAARLSISNLESADTGVYTCVARCESGVTRCSTELCVFDVKPGTDSYLQPPIFVKGLVPKRTADEGEPVQLTVRLQGAVPMSASWFKNDVLVPDCADFEYVVADDRGEFGLSITDPFVKDSGTYSCKVANSFGQAVSSGQLVINEMSSGHQVPMVVEMNNNLKGGGEKTASDFTYATRTTLPASILSGPCDTTVLRGAKVILRTSYRGDPEPCVQWLRAGKVLESDAHLCITNERGVSSLTIDSITADDCGKYVVRVDNGYGNDFHFASVAVEGPPDPPAGRPVVSVSETSADVTWSSPAYDGGCMVTGYGVEVRPFNQSDWKLVADKCHSLSHIVRGLAPGESYVFRVRAENMHGSSEASLESTPVYILQTDYGNTLWPKTVNIENGELFDEQYEVLDELGKGRYGIVYKVKERETNKYYAAKFVRCIKSTDKEKAQEEVDIMNCLRHPKLLQLDAAFDKPREVVLVTEYISGGELFERVVADDFTLTEKDCILFTRQICEGVDYMHKQNVVHLDLKPENIMCQSRTSHYVKLIDFGLAQKIIPGHPMRVLFGTPEFIPPEIIGYEPIGLESDMWSVGVICYVLLSGLSPFMGDNDSETFTNITKAEFDFDDEAFDAVSQDAKDFISALLIKRKELRLTARECLKHKWLAQQDMDMSCVILSTDKLKKFIIRRKWQKTGNAIRALGRMATLSAASRRGVSGGISAGGGVGGGTGGGNGTGCVLQKLKMASLREESAGELTPEAQEILIAETTKTGHKSCDARSDSGFSDCPSVASPTAMLVRPSECPSAISEETLPVSDQYRSPPSPTCEFSPPATHRSFSPPTHRSSFTATRRSTPPLTCRSSSPATTSSPATYRPSSPATHRSSSATHRPSSPATNRPSSPVAHRPSSPATHRPYSPANRRPFSPKTCRPLSPVTRGSTSPTTHGSSSPTTRGSSYPATRGPSSLATHLRSPLPRNRRDATNPVHDVPLPTGTAVNSVCKTNRIIFDNGRRDGSASSPAMGVQRKEPIRIQTADTFKKATAFWKQ